MNLDARPNTPFHGGPIGRSSERRVTSISGYETDGLTQRNPVCALIIDINYVCIAVRCLLTHQISMMR